MRRHLKIHWNIELGEWRLAVIEVGDRDIENSRKGASFLLSLFVFQKNDVYLIITYFAVMMK